MEKLLVPLLGALFGAAAGADPPATVEEVDLQRYTGLWYEIARLPNRFQRQCAGDVTARYRLRADGRIDVVNRCRRQDGTWDEARGVARVTDARTRARLEVSFVRLLGIQLFWGDYWIVGLDEEYEYAVVGTPDRRYGWILSRTPALNPAQQERVFDLLREGGYDPDAFVSTRHSRTDGSSLAR